MPFTEKVWEDAPSTDTPLSAAALTDLENRLSDYTDSASTAKADLPLNVKDFGAVGDGATDDTAEIQAAIDACIGPGAAASVTRESLNALYLPRGDYIISSTLLIRSVMGFRMFGDGFYSRLVLKAGTALTTLLDLDGLAYCDFSDFSIRGENETTATVDNAIHLRWSTAAARSTTSVSFHRVHIMNLKFKCGYAIEQDDGSRQGDECLYDGCRVAGAWTAGEATWWQYGMRFGNGTNGNVLNQYILKGNLANCAVGAAWAGSTGGMWGGGCQANGTDFRGEAANRSVRIQGVRSEGAERLWTHSGYSGAKAHVELHDIEWYGGQMAADTKVIDHRTAGQLRLIGVTFLLCVDDPTIDVGALGAPATHLLVTLDGVTARTAPGSLMTLTGGAEAVRMLNYAQTDASDLHVRAWPEFGVHAVASVASATTVTLPDLVALTKIATITGTTTITSVTAGYPGQEVTLVFAGVLTFTDGSNLKLSANLVSTADDTISLVCDGTNWIETARSVN